MSGTARGCANRTSPSSGRGFENGNQTSERRQSTNNNMGTDVYLEWNEKTNADEQKQVTGWGIGSGYVGYLRASIHMVQENALLRMLFPEKYWSKRSKEEYDFKANLRLLVDLGNKYLQSVENGTEMEMPEQVKHAVTEYKARNDAIVKAVQEAAIKTAPGAEVKLAVGELEGMADAIKWLKSVVGFFKLGIQKQEQGLKPYPYISW